MTLDISREQDPWAFPTVNREATVGTYPLCASGKHIVRCGLVSSPCAHYLANVTDKEVGQMRNGGAMSIK